MTIVNSKTFLFVPFLSKPLLESAFRSLKLGFFTLIWNLVLNFLILKLYSPNMKCDLEIDSIAFETALCHFSLAEINIKLAEIMRKVPFQNKEI